MSLSFSRKDTPRVPDAAVEWLKLCPRDGDAIAGNLAIDRIRDIGRTAGFTLPENCFRHSYISHRVAATGDIPRVSLDAGNSPKEINRHYRELVTEGGKQLLEESEFLLPEHSARYAPKGGSTSTSWKPQSPRPPDPLTAHARRGPVQHPCHAAGG